MLLGTFILLLFFFFIFGYKKAAHVSWSRASWHSMGSKDSQKKRDFYLYSGIWIAYVDIREGLSNPSFIDHGLCSHFPVPSTGRRSRSQPWPLFLKRSHCSVQACLDITVSCPMCFVLDRSMKRCTGAPRRKRQILSWKGGPAQFQCDLGIGSSMTRSFH